MRYSYDPDLQLSNEERARLAALTQTPEWQILQKIFKSEVDKFSEKLINVEVTKTDDILAIHMLAKSAAQFYQGVANAINKEIQTYRDMNRKDEGPLPDEVGSILDFDSAATDLGELI